MINPSADTKRLQVMAIEIQAKIDNTRSICDLIFEDIKGDDDES